jgi:hypothetical protein
MTDDEIAVPVVSAVVIEVMNFSACRQRTAECSLCDDDVLVYRVT